jgi:hypothetical protein
MADVSAEVLADRRRIKEFLDLPEARLRGRLAFGLAVTGVPLKVARQLLASAPEEQSGEEARMPWEEKTSPVWNH